MTDIIKPSLADKYSVHGKIAVISGASRGIGAKIAETLAKLGCHIAILAKTDTPHPTLGGTIHTTAETVRKAGTEALPLVCDMRSETDIMTAVDKIIAKFGHIDYLINNASAIFLGGTCETSMKQFDLMYQINVRGTYMLSRACIPFLRLSQNAHIVTFSPPLTMDATYFYPHLAYTLSKYAMSMCTLGMAHEFYHDNIAVNSLWPRTAIHTAATDHLCKGTISKDHMRKTDIMADAVHAILTKPAQACTGAFLIDDLVLMAEGVKNFDKYAYKPHTPLMQDLFLPYDLPAPPAGVTVQNFKINPLA